jgi:hypothetical protein
MGFFNNLFNNNTIVHESDNANDWYWLNSGTGSTKFSNPLYQYRNNFALQSIINLRASYFTKGNFKVLDSNGNEIEGHPLTNLFKQPNFLLSKNDFLKEWVVLLSLYGSEAIYVDGTIGMDSVENIENLINVDSSCLKTEYSFKDLFNNNKMKSVELKFEDGSKQLIEPSELIRYYDSVNILEGKDITKGVSRVQGCWESLQNINKALDAKNVLLGMPGGLGMITANPVNKQGQIVAMQPKEKEELERKLHTKRGLGSGKNAILTSTKPLKFESFVQRLKQFGYDEAVDSDLSRIAVAFNIPLDLLIKTGTYENQSSAEKRYIQGDIEQLSRNFCQPFTDKYLEDGQELVMDYRHLGVFDFNPIDDIVKLSNAVLPLIENGVIDVNDAKEMFEQIRSNTLKN